MRLYVGGLPWYVSHESLREWRCAFRCPCFGVQVVRKHSDATKVSAYLTYNNGREQQVAMRNLPRWYDHYPLTIAPAMDKPANPKAPYPSGQQPKTPAAAAAPPPPPKPTPQQPCEPQPTPQEPPVPPLAPEPIPPQPIPEEPPTPPLPQPTPEEAEKPSHRYRDNPTLFPTARRSRNADCAARRAPRLKQWLWVAPYYHGLKGFDLFCCSVEYWSTSPCIKEILQFLSLSILP